LKNHQALKKLHERLKKEETRAENLQTKQTKKNVSRTQPKFIRRDFCCPNQQPAVIKSRLSANLKIKRTGSSPDCSIKKKKNGVIKHGPTLKKRHRLGNSVAKL
jgi:hypothetical protein